VHPWQKRFSSRLVLVDYDLVFGFSFRFGHNYPRRFDRADAFAGYGSYLFGLVKPPFGLGLPLGRLFLLYGHDKISRQGGPMLKSIGLPELLVILVVAMLLFGGKKIPELAKGLGQGIRNFKEAVKDEPPSTPPDEKKPS
jgi:sec-independent protein translocase protein TatA